MKKTVTLKLSISDHQKLKIMCTKKNMSMQDFMEMILYKYFRENNIKID